MLKVGDYCNHDRTTAIGQLLDRTGSRPKTITGCKVCGKIPDSGGQTIMSLAASLMRTGNLSEIRRMPRHLVDLLTPELQSVAFETIEPAPRVELTEPIRSVGSINPVTA
ncbi:MAG: hypothetical protein WC297_02990 [Candidatus Paceibacterota bacterium]|jgi:hypothetical protein